MTAWLWLTVYVVGVLRLVQVAREQYRNAPADDRSPWWYKWRAFVLVPAWPLLLLVLWCFAISRTTLGLFGDGTTDVTQP